MADQFLPYRTQLQHLRSKGLFIPNGSKAMRILEREGYHAIINGYRDPFCHASTPTFSFKNGTHFDEVHALYEFDRDLRNIYLKKMLRLEQNIRSSIAYSFSKRNRTNNRAYLDFRNFDYRRTEKTISTRHGGTRSVKLNKDVHFVTSMLNSKMSNRYNNVIKHYVSEHQSVPLWILVNTLTIGELEHLYIFLTPTIRDEVSNVFSLTDQELQWFISQLKIYRNICAHEERFYCSSQSWGMINIYSLYQKMIVLLPTTDANRFTTQLSNLFKRYQGKFTTINFSDILTKMGFPLDFI